jgi:hypothetical protein
MRSVIFFLVMSFAAPAALADEAVPKPEQASGKQCQFYTHNCERCGFDENGKLWCTTPFFGCRITGFDCLIEADGSKPPNG